MRSELKCKVGCPYDFNCGDCLIKGKQPGVVYIKRHSLKLYRKIERGVDPEPKVSAVDRGTVELGNQFFWLRAGELQRK